MSIVALDWPRIETETPGGKLAGKRSASGREEVFRCALAVYIADYGRHLATMAADRNRGVRLIRPSVLTRLAQWL